MADLKTQTLETEDPTPFPAKRDPESECLDQEIDHKKQKPENFGSKEDKITETEDNKENQNGKDGNGEEDGGGNGVSLDLVDRKGKGIMREDKGKGKMVVEEEGSIDDDDCSDDYVGEFSDDDSDFSNDPLAEVDLDNILPARTRRRVSQPGAYLVNDLDGGGGGGDGDDSE